MKTESVFTKIIKGELPSYKLWENEYMILILDINPIAPGHCLLIPKEQIEYIFDVKEDLYHLLWNECRWISKVLEDVTKKRIGIGVEGLSVPHVHIHLVPIESVGDLDPCKSQPALKEDLDEMHMAIINRMMVQQVAGADAPRGR